MYCRRGGRSGVGGRPGRASIRLVHVPPPAERPRLRLLPGRRTDRKYPHGGDARPRATANVPHVGHRAERHGQQLITERTISILLCSHNGHTMRKQGSCLEKEIMQGTMPGARRRGRPRTAWMDNIKTWTGLSVEVSIRMTEDRDKWRKYVHGVANPRIEDG